MPHAQDVEAILQQFGSKEKKAFRVTKTWGSLTVTRLVYAEDHTKASAVFDEELKHLVFESSPTEIHIQVWHMPKVKEEERKEED